MSKMGRKKGDCGNDPEVGVIVNLLLGKLSARRVMSCVSQEQLAGKLGLHQSSISKWELQKHCITLAEFVKYAKTVGLDITKEWIENWGK